MVPLVLPPLALMLDGSPRLRRLLIGFVEAWLVLVSVVVVGLLASTFFTCSSLQVNLERWNAQLPGRLSSLHTDALAEASTYLTIPEWYIVYAARDTAQILSTKPPSAMPYVQQTRQYWCTYHHASQLTRSRYGVAAGTHLMLLVIGASFTTENLGKSAYENTVGRVSEWLAGGATTAEDAFAQRQAKRYADWLDQTPWYDYPFGADLAALWTDVPLLGPGLLRKWERRVVLSLEYLAKATYGSVIRWLTHVTYDPAAQTIRLRTRLLPPGALSANLRVTQVVDPGGETVVLTAPRYQAFTVLLQRLAELNVQVLEVSGHDEIAVSVLASASWKPATEDATILFADALVADARRQRVVLQVPVDSLHRFLSRLGNQATLEHVYDY